MRVRLRVDISGTRGGADGPEEWPPRGAEVDLPDQEGADLCAAGMADSVMIFKRAEVAVPPPPEERSALDESVVPSAEDVGRAARAAGRPRSANPFDGRSADGRAWLRGWDSAGL